MERKLILGTVQFGLDYGVNNTVGKASSAAVKEILDAAAEHGVLLLDSAETYGDSQEKIGTNWLYPFGLLTLSGSEDQTLGS